MKLKIKKPKVFTYNIASVHFKFEIDTLLELEEDYRTKEIIAKPQVLFSSVSWENIHTGETGNAFMQLNLESIVIEENDLSLEDNIVIEKFICGILVTKDMFNLIKKGSTIEVNIDEVELHLKND